MRAILTVISILFIFSDAQAQSGNIDVMKPYGLDTLVKHKGQPVPPEVRTQVKGYRIQLFFDLEKDEVNEARSKFISKYSNLETYVAFNNTYHVLKVGDFRTHLEADRILSTVKEEFPTAFIIKELIYLPNIDKQEIK